LIKIQKLFQISMNPNRIELKPTEINQNALDSIHFHLFSDKFKRISLKSNEIH